MVWIGSLSPFAFLLHARVLTFLKWTFVHTMGSDYTNTLLIVATAFPITLLASVIWKVFFQRLFERRGVPDGLKTNI